MNTKTSPKQQFLSFKKAFDECSEKDVFERGFLISAIQLNADICWAKLTDKLLNEFKVFHDVIAAYRLIGSEVNFQDLYGFDDELDFNYEYCPYSNFDLEDVMDKVLSDYDKATENDKSWFNIEFGDIDGLIAKIDQTIAFMKKTPEGDNLISSKLISGLFTKLTDNL